ncbi:MAG: FtsX-like permease family protein, partial [Proteocatella sp.]
IKSRIISGKTDLGGNQILIGKDFAQEYSVGPGDVITLTLPSAARESFIIEGIFDLQSAGLNSSWIFMDMLRAQKLYKLSGYVNSIELQITDPFAADTQGDILKQIFPELKIQNWKQQNAQLLSALNSQSSSSYTIQAFVLIAIALGIASVLAVSVVQKSKQIGILKAMGVTGKSASKIFVIQGGVMGFLGAIAGIIMGALLIKAFIAGTPGSGGLGFEITIKPANMAVVLCVSTISGIVSSLIPARSSAKLNPMEVIRNG